MAKTIVEWFDKQIEWAESQQKLTGGMFPEPYYLGYKHGLKEAKEKLLREGIV